MQLSARKRAGDYAESEEGEEAVQVPMFLHFPSNRIGLTLQDGLCPQRLLSTFIFSAVFGQGWQDPPPVLEAPLNPPGCLTDHRTPAAAKTKARTRNSKTNRNSSHGTQSF